MHELRMIFQYEFPLREIGIVKRRRFGRPTLSSSTKMSILIQYVIVCPAMLSACLLASPGVQITCVCTQVCRGHIKWFLIVGDVLWQPTNNRNGPSREKLLVNTNYRYH